MTDPCGFYWVEQGRLAGSALPSGCLKWLFNEKGIRAILSLEPLSSKDSRTARSLGMQCEVVAINDFTAGTSEQRDKALKILDRFLSKGLPTVVHCKGGLGRTGMILAIYLVRRKGFPPQTAIARIRQLRPGSIEPDTGQEEAVVETSEVH